MNSLSPADIVATAVWVGTAKSALGTFDRPVRGARSSALLGAVTSLAIGATAQTGQPIVGGPRFTGRARYLTYRRMGGSLPAALPAVADRGGR